MDSYFLGVIFILGISILYGLWIFCDYYFFRPQRNNRINRIINIINNNNNNNNNNYNNNNNNNNNYNANNETDVVVEIPPTYDDTITMPYYDGNESPPPPAY